MNILLLAAWSVLYVFGLLFQIGSAKFYINKRAQQNGADMSLIFLLSSLLLAPFVFNFVEFIIILISTSYLLWNAWVLHMWRFHPIRTKNQVTRSALLIFAFTVILIG